MTTPEGTSASVIPNLTATEQQQLLMAFAKMVASNTDLAASEGIFDRLFGRKKKKNKKHDSDSDDDEDDDKSTSKKKKSKFGFSKETPAAAATATIPPLNTKGEATLAPAQSQPRDLNVTTKPAAMPGSDVDTVLAYAKASLQSAGIDDPRLIMLPDYVWDDLVVPHPSSMMSMLTRLSHFWSHFKGSLVPKRRKETQKWLRYQPKTMARSVDNAEDPETLEGHLIPHTIVVQLVTDELVLDLFVPNLQFHFTRMSSTFVTEVSHAITQHWIFYQPAHDIIPEGELLLFRESNKRMFHISPHPLDTTSLTAYGGLALLFSDGTSFNNRVFFGHATGGVTQKSVYSFYFDAHGKLAMIGLTYTVDNDKRISLELDDDPTQDMLASQCRTVELSAAKCAQLRASGVPLSADLPKDGSSIVLTNDPQVLLAGAEANWFQRFFSRIKRVIRPASGKVAFVLINAEELMKQLTDNPAQLGVTSERATKMIKALKVIMKEEAAAGQRIGTIEQITLSGSTSVFTSLKEEVRKGVEYTWYNVGNDAAALVLANLNFKTSSIVDKNGLWVQGVINVNITDQNKDKQDLLTIVPKEFKFQFSSSMRIASDKNATTVAAVAPMSDDDADGPNRVIIMELVRESAFAPVLIRSIAAIAT